MPFFCVITSQVEACEKVANRNDEENTVNGNAIFLKKFLMDLETFRNSQISEWLRKILRKLLVLLL